MVLRELFRARITSNATRNDIARAMHEVEKQAIADSMSIVAKNEDKEDKVEVEPVKPPTRKAA